MPADGYLLKSKVLNTAKLYRRRQSTLNKIDTISNKMSRSTSYAAEQEEMMSGGAMENVKIFRNYGKEGYGRRLSLLWE